MMAIRNSQQRGISRAMTNNKLVNGGRRDIAVQVSEIGTRRTLQRPRTRPLRSS